MQPPPPGDTWVGLTSDPLPVAAAYEWAVRPNCGAVVLFSGTVRDHAPGRDGVDHLTYETYEEHVGASFGEVVAELRLRWPQVARVAILHRAGRVEVGDSSVVVAVSAPHRDAAFEAGRFAIDAVKATAPIWKRESWASGSDWGLGATALTQPSDVGSA